MLPLFYIWGQGMVKKPVLKMDGVLTADFADGIKEGGDPNDIPSPEKLIPAGLCC
jgi:hypothetical protein